MAFNFSWNPLIADTSRAKDMLTAALNKSPKPPIIVDDIIVHELNLGSTPPELEILEIGDLAEDRFRGIFKMSYTGDAYLTLKTRVQANPLNTYLSTKSDFASPQPLAAASSLTIPLQISLSDIRLSGFVILVFSKQKGITLVFRNDPLESLKVSSTFDSIPFVRNYLQKEIEGQLRVLFMDDLPAIIHKLSLRVWNPEYKRADDVQKTSEGESEEAIDPLAVPAHVTTNMSGSGVIGGDMSFASDDPDEIHATFSQKNLLRLAALTESQRTLSLFTPSMRDTVFRAWAGVHDKVVSPGTLTPLTRPHVLSRLQSSCSHSAWSSNASEASDSLSTSSRPSFSAASSAATTYTLSSGRSRPASGRKRTHRVVNLRKPQPQETPATPGTTLDTSQHSSPLATMSEQPISPSTPASTDNYSNQSHHGSAAKVRFDEEREQWVPVQADGSNSRPVTPLKQKISMSDYPDPDTTPRPTLRHTRRKTFRPSLTQLDTAESSTSGRPGAVPRSMSAGGTFDMETSDAQLTGGILEQAWMMKVQAEVQRRAAWEKVRRASGGDMWERRDEEEKEETPPPAYAA